MSTSAPRKYKVFISSTMEDLKNERDAVEQVIRDLGHTPIRAETFPPQSCSPRETVLRMVQECDILVGIYGARYGDYKLDDEKISVTEFEFWTATRLGKEILISVAQVADDDRDQEMRDFLKRVQDFDTGLFRRPFYKSTDELVNGIRDGLCDLINDSRFHLFTFKEYARKLITWSMEYKQSRWAGRYTELNAKAVSTIIGADRHELNRSEPLPLSDAIAQNQMMLIVGEAGAGKTTALLHMIKHMAEGVLASTSKRVPVFVALNAWTENQDLESLISANLAALGRQVDPERLSSYLADGRFILALDGVNEIPPRKRRGAAERDLATFIKQNSLNQIIATSRLIAYDRVAFENWPVFEIQPLDYQTSLDFAINYLGTTKGKELLHKLGGDDPSQWKKPESLVSLARNPFLLLMLTYMFERHEEIPQQKVALIKAFVEDIFERREQGKASQYPPALKYSLLRQLAFEMIEHGEIARTTQERALGVFSKAFENLRKQHMLEPQMTVLDLLDELRSNGLVSLDGDSAVLWRHQLFQEFFAALELVRRFDAGKPVWRQLNKACWKEPAIMAAGLTAKPKEYLEEVLNGWRGIVGIFFFENPRALLAINCVHETYLWNSETFRRGIIPSARLRIGKGLNQRMIQLLGAIVSRLCRPFGAVLLQLGRLQSTSYLIVGPIVWTLGEIEEHRALDILTRNLRNSDRVVRWIAADALRKLRDPAALDSLLGALEDYDGDVRWVAIQSLIYIGDPRVASAFAALLNHPDPVTRWAAAFGLGKIGTISNIPDLETVRDIDHTLLWWGEYVSQAADIAIREISVRNSKGIAGAPDYSRDMLQRAMFGRHEA